MITHSKSDSAAQGANVSRETVLEANFQVFSDICLSLDKLYAYLNHLSSVSQEAHKDDVVRFLDSARELYLFSAAAMNSIKSQLEEIDNAE